MKISNLDICDFIKLNFFSYLLVPMIFFISVVFFQVNVLIFLLILFFKHLSSFCISLRNIFYSFHRINLMWQSIVSILHLTGNNPVNKKNSGIPGGPCVFLLLSNSLVKNFSHPKNQKPQ